MDLAQGKLGGRDRCTSIPSWPPRRASRSGGRARGRSPSAAAKIFQARAPGRTVPHESGSAALGDRARSGSGGNAGFPTGKGRRLESRCYGGRFMDGRSALRITRFRLLTSAATVLGCKARTLARGLLIPAWTRSRPLARPGWAFAAGKFLSPFPKRLTSPPRRRESVRRALAMSRNDPVENGDRMRPACCRRRRAVGFVLTHLPTVGWSAAVGEKVAARRRKLRSVKYCSWKNGAKLDERRRRRAAGAGTRAACAPRLYFGIRAQCTRRPGIDPAESATRQHFATQPKEKCVRGR